MTKIVRIVTRMNIGGPAIHVALLSSRLDPAVFTTCLVTGTPQKDEGSLEDLVSGSGVRLIRVPELRRPIRPWADAVALIRILWILWKERPDVLHTHMAKAGALGRVAGSFYNAFGPGRRPESRLRIFHTFHGHVLDGYFSTSISSAFLRIERWLARRTDTLVAVSDTIRKQLLEKGIGRPEQWRVVKLGFDLQDHERLLIRQQSNPVTIGMVGRLVPIKNPGLFVEGIDRLRRVAVDPEIRGWIIGDGPLRPQLEREIQQRKLEATVQFAGWQHELIRWYERLDVVCVTSWNEGTPATLIEAMAAGRAVVATDVGGIRDLLDGAQTETPIRSGGFQVARRGILVRAGDAQGFSAALEKVVGDTALRHALGEAARSYVLNTFNAKRLVADITSLYVPVEVPRPVATACSVVVPVHNEAGMVEASLRRMVELFRGAGLSFEIVVCENGSRDATLSLVRSVEAEYPEVRVERTESANYGLALKQGFASCRNEVVMVFNIDFWDMAFVRAALSRLETCDLVIGSKAMRGSSDRRPLIRRLITRSFNAFLRIVFGFRGTDTHGMKAFRFESMRSILDACVTDHFLLDTEIVLRAQKSGLRIQEIPVHIREIRAPSYRTLAGRAPQVFGNLFRLWFALKRR